MHIYSTLSENTFLDDNKSYLAKRVWKRLKPDIWPLSIKELPSGSALVGGAVRDGLLNRLKEKPDLEGEIESGNLGTVREWLNQKIHQKGRLFSVSELVNQVTGDNLNPTVFLDYLNTKYRKIYRLDQ